MNEHSERLFFTFPSEPEPKAPCLLLNHRVSSLFHTSPTFSSLGFHPFFSHSRGKTSKVGQENFRTHQVAKLDGGESGLDDGPQAPKEVGRQREPIFTNKLVPFPPKRIFQLLTCVGSSSAHLLTSMWSASFRLNWSSAHRFLNPGSDSRR